MWPPVWILIIILVEPVQRLGGGRGCNKFVPVLGGNGTRITPTGDIFDQLPGEMQWIQGKVADHVGDHVVLSPEGAVLVTYPRTKSSHPRPPQSLNPSLAEQENRRIPVPICAYLQIWCLQIGSAVQSPVWPFILQTKVESCVYSELLPFPSLTARLFHKRRPPSSPSRSTIKSIVGLPMALPPRVRRHSARSS